MQDFEFGRSPRSAGSYIDAAWFLDLFSGRGLRGRYNERNDFLITTTPPVNEAPPATSPMIFPHIADSGGYTTQFILFSAQPGSSSSGTMQLFNQSGGALGLTLQ